MDPESSLYLQQVTISRWCHDDTWFCDLIKSYRLEKVLLELVKWRYSKAGSHNYEKVNLKKRNVMKVQITEEGKLEQKRLKMAKLKTITKKFSSSNCQYVSWSCN